MVKRESRAWDWLLGYDEETTGRLNLLSVITLNSANEPNNGEGFGNDLWSDKLVCPLDAGSDVCQRGWWMKLSLEFRSAAMPCEVINFHSAPNHCKKFVSHFWHVTQHFLLHAALPPTHMWPVSTQIAGKTHKKRETFVFGVGRAPR